MTTPILRRDKIFIRDMAFHANHGAFEHEKDYPQRFMIDFEGEMFLAPPAETDEVRDTVRYDLVAETIREVVPTLDADRSPSPDIAGIVRLILGGRFGF